MIDVFPLSTLTPTSWISTFPLNSLTPKKISIKNKNLFFYSTGIERHSCTIKKPVAHSPKNFLKAPRWTARYKLGEALQNRMWGGGSVFFKHSPTPRVFLRQYCWEEFFLCHSLCSKKFFVLILYGSALTLNVRCNGRYSMAKNMKRLRTPKSYFSCINTGTSSPATVLYSLEKCYL